MHLREDRRHIQDQDMFDVREHTGMRLNMEMAMAESVVHVARQIKPDMITLVPERREEITTEGGLDAAGQIGRIRDIVDEFQPKGTLISLFIEPEEKAVRASAESGAAFIEFHTGAYALAGGDDRQKELQRLFNAAEYALSLGLRVNAGHGLNYENIVPIRSMPGLVEVNIGHSIISRAVFTGLRQAIEDMAALLVLNKWRRSED
jgi:pyridoxine 5-phosphate synthase